MSDWLWQHVVPSVVVAAVLLLALWPTERSGASLLRTWGLPSPNSTQVAEAVRYLRQRRLLYVVLFLVGPPLAGLVWRGSTVPGFGVVVPLLVALLIAELVATLRPVSGLRVASLEPRSWRDLVPRWAVGTAGLLVLLTVAFAAVAVAEGESAGWVALGSGTLCLVVVVLLVHLAVRRPAVADPTADAALRVRTARVAVGIGFGWLGAAVLTATERVHFLVVVEGVAGGWFGAAAAVAGPVAQFGGILAWVWLTTPSRRSLVRT